VKIGVVDYEAGNLRSVETALSRLGADYTVSQDPETLLRSDRVIFPGVGEARAAMETLRSRGLEGALVEFATKGKLLLGICIGCQIALDYSEERDTKCLGLVPGRVQKFDTGKGYKVPHMGWNEVIPTREDPLFEGIPRGSSFYFVHSFYPEAADARYELCYTEYINRFSSCIRKDNVYAVQFHPEKSGRFGLKLLENFLKLRE
jgi:glutamine amidotransferase